MSQKKNKKQKKSTNRAGDHGSSGKSPCLASAKPVKKKNHVKNFKS
jgi:hypothetical protein